MVHACLQRSVAAVQKFGLKQSRKISTLRGLSVAYILHPGRRLPRAHKLARMQMHTHLQMHSRLQLHASTLHVACRPLHAHTRTHAARTKRAQLVKAIRHELEGHLPAPQVGLDTDAVDRHLLVIRTQGRKIRAGVQGSGTGQGGASKGMAKAWPSRATQAL